MQNPLITSPLRTVSFNSGAIANPDRINSPRRVIKSPFGPNNCKRRLSEFLQKELNTTTDLANQLAVDLLNEQKEQRRGQSKVFKASRAVPKDIQVTKDVIYLQGDSVGVGVSSCANRSVAFATNRGNDENFPAGSPRDVVVKTRKPCLDGKVLPYSPMEQAVKRVLGKREREVVSPAADLAYATYKETDPLTGEVVAALSVHERCEHDLSHTDFNQMDNPVFSILKVFVDVLQDLDSLHSQGKIHRDIKGPNILIKLRNEHEEIKGKLTDWDTLMDERDSVHGTTGSWDYLAPFMFGPPEVCLLHQKLRCGIQTKKGDLFALGITLFKDVLFKFIWQASKRNPDQGQEVQEMLKTIPIDVIKGPFSPDDLANHGRNSNYRTIYKVKEKTNEEVLFKYPEIDRMNTVLKEACSKLTSLSPEEINALTALCDQCCEMQKENSPTTRAILNNLFEEIEKLQPAFKPKRRFLDFDQALQIEDEELEPTQIVNSQIEEEIEQFIQSQFTDVIPTQNVPSVT